MKPILKVVSGPSGLGEKFQLLANRAFVAGRAGACTAIFAADELMSTTHFSLAVSAQGYFLTDLGSTNGTFVNGKRIAHCQVHPGDEIQAGRSLFQIELEHEIEYAPTPPALLSIPSPVFQSELPKQCLSITTKQGHERKLDIGQRVTVGRTGLAEWVFPSDPRMSSEHFAIQSTSGKWEVVDLSSSNGTFVNELRVSRSWLQSGDSIQAGDTHFFLSFIEAMHPPSEEMPNSVPASIANPSTPIIDNASKNENFRPAGSTEAEWIPLQETLVDPQTPKIKPKTLVALECLTQPNMSTELEQGQQLLIGRSIYADISVPNDSKISTEHAKVRVISQDQVVIEDLSSTNGTTVNGTRIQEAVLHHGDQFLIGEQAFRIRFLDREMPSTPLITRVEPAFSPSVEVEIISTPPSIPDKASQPTQQPSRQPWRVESDIPNIDPAIPFESFPCGSGLVFFSGCLPAFDPIDIARRLTLATPGWLLKPGDSNNQLGNDRADKAPSISIERISPMDPSWMIPWSQIWGQQRSLVIYSRSDESKIRSTFQSLFETLDAKSQKFPTHSQLFDFLANRLSDTVNRVFSPLDAILIELYGGKQWAYMAPRDLESVLPQLHFRKKHRW